MSSTMSKNKLLGTIAGIVSVVAITSCQASLPSGPSVSSVPNTSASYVITNNVKQPGRHLYMPAGRYVALGDSFSSGEGTPAFWPETDHPSDTCHRSDRAYSQILGTIDEHPGVPKPDHADFVACSGAKLQALFENNADNQTELPQQNRLDDTVGLITLTMSGNNVGFGPILSDCVTSFDPKVKTALSLFAAFFPPLLPPVENHGAGQCQYRNQSQLDINLNWMDGTRLDSSDNPQSLEKVYLHLRNKAPKARILILGYPHEFQQNPTDSCQSIAPEDQSWSNTKLVDRLNAVIRRNIDAANIDPANNAELPIEYLDTVKPFLPYPQAGGGCGAAHITAFNGLLDIEHLGIDYQGLFHPTEYGNMILAQVVMDDLMQPAPPGLPPVSLRRPLPPVELPSWFKIPPFPSPSPSAVFGPNVPSSPPAIATPSPQPPPQPSPQPSSKATVGCGSDADTFLQFMKDQGAKVTDVVAPPICLDGYAEEDFTFAPGPTSNYPTFFFQKDWSLSGWKLLGGGAVGDASSICQAMPAKVRAAFTLSSGSDSGCPAG
jgi:hypothetical protein